MKLRTLLGLVGLSVLSSSCYMDSLYYESAWVAPHHYAAPRVSASYSTYAPPVYVRPSIAYRDCDRSYAPERVVVRPSHRDWDRGPSRYCPPAPPSRHYDHSARPVDYGNRRGSYSFSYSSY